MNGIWRLAGWSLEAGVFGGTEPEGPYDFSNIRGSPDSWSGRLARRWTQGAGSATEWEASVSHARVTESHHGLEETSRLLNAALRRSGPDGSDGFFRYDHDGHATAATRWLIATAAYARQLSSHPVSLRPFLEVQYHRVRAERGNLPRGEFPGTASSFWVLSLGARLFLGGGPKSPVVLNAPAGRSRFAPC